MEKQKKTFYRIVIREYLNGLKEYPHHTYCSTIHFGNMETAKAECPKDLKLTKYEDLIAAIKEAKKANLKTFKVLEDLYIKKNFRKLYVYSESLGWVEEGFFHAGRISPKTFKSYEVEYRIEEVKPTVEMLIKSISVDYLLEYLTDHPEVASIFGTAIKDKKRLVESK